MRKKIITGALFFLSVFAFGQDWNNISIPVKPGAGEEWVLQPTSDDFNYDAPANNKGTEFAQKWTDFYHNNWTGPSPTVWRKDHSLVANGNLQIIASRPSGTTTTNTGCITSKVRIIYPAYVEARVKICNSVLASDVWMLSADDTQEIDICEAYGSDRYTNEWFSPKRLHLSHHVFVRNPFQDWQPSDAGSFYTNGSTIWRNDYHRIGVYWKDPWNLEYYVDGVKVRTRSGVNEIDPKNYTNGTGLSKEMDLIINTEDQTWRANQGLTPTNAELANTENNTFKVDWVRVYHLEDINTSSKDLSNNTLQIFPNPCADFVQVKSNQKINQLTIYKMDSTAIKKEKAANKMVKLDTRNLYPGYYLLKIEMKNGTSSIQRLIKQ